MRTIARIAKPSTWARMNTADARATECAGAYHARGGDGTAPLGLIAAGGFGVWYTWFVLNGGMASSGH